MGGFITKDSAPLFIVQFLLKLACLRVKHAATKLILYLRFFFNLFKFGNELEKCEIISAKIGNLAVQMAVTFE